MKLKKIIILIFILSNFILPQKVLYVKSKVDSPYALSRLNVVSRFYGISLDSITIDHKKVSDSLGYIIERNKYDAVIINYSVLSSVPTGIIPETNSPILIMGIGTDASESSLRAISNNIVSGCKRIENNRAKGILNIGNERRITYQLSNQIIPFKTDGVNYLNIENTNHYTSIIDYIDITNTNHSLFGKLKDANIFFLVKLNALKSKEKIDYRRSDFFELAPFMFFIRYSLGEHIWHTNDHFANLTVDDPWLVEPYGYLNYHLLLKEMERHNFHTTIAFIPWNYDRSKQDVISLFKSNPERFSITIHGNNHDHREFESYNKRPLVEHEEDIKQALARMREFKRLTNIHYDTVMIFPHGIAPAKTLWLLKKYNFWATVNASNIPLDSEEPSDPFFNLRNVTLAYEDFPSLNRASSKDVYPYHVAVDLFLDIPLLFSCHHEFFRDGTSSFNDLADLINEIDPDIKWMSLGNITKHLYLERLRYDGDYDIHTFSGNITITNDKKKDAKFYISKYENNSPEIDNVLINDKPYPFTLSSEEILSLIIKIPDGETRDIFIRYKNNLNLSKINIAKNNVRVNLLRSLSDFRDLYFTTNSIGFFITSLFYKSGIDKLGLVGLFFILLFIFCLAFLSFYYLRKLYKARLYKTKKIDIPYENRGHSF